MAYFSRARGKERHSAKDRHLPQAKYVMESIIDWNGPSTNECEPFLIEALHFHFKGKDWHFTSSDGRSRFTKFTTSEVIDRLKKEKSNYAFKWT